MIYFDMEKKCILTPPHVASNHIHEACCAGHRVWWVNGMNQDGVIDHHCNEQALGVSWKGAQIACVVRHPVDRLVGLFEHYLKFSTLTSDPLLNWADFVRKTVSGDHQYWIYRTTISRWLGKTPVDTWIRYENLQEDLDTFVGYEVELKPALNLDRDWDGYLSDSELIAAIEEWAADDMERWGYTSRQRQDV